MAAFFLRAVQGGVVGERVNLEKSEYQPELSFGESRKLTQTITLS